MHAQKLARAETSLQRCDRLPQDVRVAANVQADVIARRLGPINLAGFQADNLSVGFDHDALRSVLPRLQITQKVEHSPLEHTLRRMLQLLAGMAERFR